MSTPAAFNRFCSPSLSLATVTTVTPGYEPDWDCRLRRLGRGALGAGSRPALIALATPALKRPSTMVQACCMN